MVGVILSAWVQEVGRHALQPVADQELNRDGVLFDAPAGRSRQLAELGGLARSLAQQADEQCRQDVGGGHSPYRSKVAVTMSRPSTKLGENETFLPGP
jgi:hypothetical protein